MRKVGNKQKFTRRSITRTDRTLSHLKNMLNHLKVIDKHCKLIIAENMQLKQKIMRLNEIAE